MSAFQEFPIFGTWLNILQLQFPIPHTWYMLKLYLQAGILLDSLANNIQYQETRYQEKQPN